MKKKILHQAFEELSDAIAYYEEQQVGLGLRLKDEVDQHVNWILDNSTVPQVRRGSYRRVNLKVFTYYIAYIIREDTLWILAIAHSHRKPEYWIKRKNEISQQVKEPSHIHVATPGGECKFWLEPIRLARNKGVSPHVIREIEKLIYEYCDLLKEKYNEIHNY